MASVGAATGDATTGDATSGDAATRGVLTAELRIAVIGPRLVANGLALELADHVGDVRTANDPDDLELLVRAWPTDVVIALVTPGPRSVAQLAPIVAGARGVPVLAVLLEVPTRGLALAALDADVAGLQLLGDGAEVISEAAASTARGEAVIHPRVARWLLDAWSGKIDARAVLSTRELEVLELVVRGLQNKQIAARLGISTGTVKSHLSRVYQQIGVRSRTEAALWLAEHRRPGEAGYPSAS